MADRPLKPWERSRSSGGAAAPANKRLPISSPGTQQQQASTASSSSRPANGATAYNSATAANVTLDLDAGDQDRLVDNSRQLVSTNDTSTLQNNNLSSTYNTTSYGGGYGGGMYGGGRYGGMGNDGSGMMGQGDSTFFSGTADSLVQFGDLLSVNGQLLDWISERSTLLYDKLRHVAEFLKKGLHALSSQAQNGNVQSRLVKSLLSIASLFCIFMMWCIRQLISNSARRLPNIRPSAL